MTNTTHEGTSPDPEEGGSDADWRRGPNPPPQSRSVVLGKEVQGHMRPDSGSVPEPPPGHRSVSRPPPGHTSTPRPPPDASSARPPRMKERDR
jgi:hypothetical protein